MPGLILRYWREVLFAAVVIPLAFGFWLRGVQLDACRESLKAEKSAHKVTRASVDTLKAEVEAQNAAVATLARTAVEKQKAAQEALRKARERETKLAGTIDRLERSASVVRPGPACEASDAVREGWQ